MPVETIVTCTICKKEIDEKDKGFAVEGNVCTVNKNEPYGVGGGIFGDNKWIEVFLSPTHGNTIADSVKRERIISERVRETIPKNHFHMTCFVNYMNNQAFKD